MEYIQLPSDVFGSMVQVLNELPCRVARDLLNQVQQTVRKVDDTQTTDPAAPAEPKTD